MEHLQSHAFLISVFLVKLIGAFIGAFIGARVGAEMAWRRVELNEPWWAPILWFARWLLGVLVRTPVGRSIAWRVEMGRWRRQGARQYSRGRGS